MGNRLVIAAGLVAGVLVGGLAVGGAVALLPPPPPPVLPTSSPLALATPTPSPTIVPSATPTPSSSASATPSGSAAPSVSGSAGPSATASGSVNFGVGQLAPDLKLAKLGGGTLSLIDYRGKPVWVNFMATWCPSCRDELPQMQGFAARYAKTGLTILLVDVKEPDADVRAYLQSLGVTLPMGLDTDGSAAQAWRALALPVHFWLTADGVVAAGAAGAIGADQMATNLGAVLPGVTVTP